MALAFGEKTVSKAYFGTKVVSAIYLGTKKVFPDEEVPGTGDIRLRIKTTTANQSFPLFHQITTEEGGFVTVDWGDGNTETLTDMTTYSPKHTYAKAGEYIVKLTGSKFTKIEGLNNSGYNDFQNAVKEILSLKMPTDSTSVSLRRAFFGCTGLTGNIPGWDDCITNAEYTFGSCTGLTGNIPEWGVNILDAGHTYYNCIGLTGNIPEWGTKIKDSIGTYYGCTHLTGNIPKWGANIWSAMFTYQGCTGLTGNIPEWGANITDASYTYYGCIGLTGCSKELLQDPMPSRITSHGNCVFGCANAVRQHFTPDWGGTKEELPAEGDIRLRIETMEANLTFPLFYKITTEEGGFVTVDWGDGNTETFTGDTTYKPTHTYTGDGEYVVKLTGSKITGVIGFYPGFSDAFQDSVREILSLKMPTDSVSVSLCHAFRGCDNLTGNIPEWSANIINASGTYYGCIGLTGNIPKWGVNITSADGTYVGCYYLTGSIPKWGSKITNAKSTYNGCVRLTGSVPEWGANITDASYTYRDCTGLTGSIPAWGARITNANGTYFNCGRLDSCSEKLLQDPMPSRITSHDACVYGAGGTIRRHFTYDWGGTKER